MHRPTSTSCEQKNQDVASHNRNVAETSRTKCRGATTVLAPAKAQASAVLQQDRQRSSKARNWRRGAHETNKEVWVQVAQGDSHKQDRRPVVRGWIYRHNRFRLTKTREVPPSKPVEPVQHLMINQKTLPNNQNQQRQVASAKSHAAPASAEVDLIYRLSVTDDSRCTWKIMCVINRLVTELT